MKNNNLMIVIVFLFLIYIPNISYWFLKDKMDNNNYENRELYEKPKLEFSSITSYFSNYEKYFNDHLAFKNEIRKFRSSILLNIFKTSSTDRVIIGKDNWLFYNSVVSESVSVNTLTDYINIYLYNQEEKNKFLNTLEDTNKYLKDNDVDLYIMVIPNKENIYFENMPSIINRHKQMNKLDDLVDYLNSNSSLNIVYPKKELLNKKYSTYYKYDTHWNDYGAYIGVKKLIKQISPNLKFEDVNIKFLESSGDLANMNLMYGKLKNKEPKITNFLTNIHSTCKNIDNYVECTSDGLEDKTLVFVGDSFRNATIQYLSKVYRKTIFVHRNSYNQDLIGKYSADIVIYEVVERYINFLNNISILKNGN